MLKQINAVALAAVLASLASDVHGHGHLVSPRSRNYVAQKDGVWWPLDGSTPYPETCSHCKIVYLFSLASFILSLILS